LAHFTITASLMLVGDCGVSRGIANYSPCTKEYEDAPAARTPMVALQHLVAHITPSKECSAECWQPQRFAN
jgi:hypothetical protein